MHRHVQKSPLLRAVLPKLSRVAFRNPKIAFRNPKKLRDKLITDDTGRGNFLYGRGNCQISNVLKPALNCVKSSVLTQQL